MTVKEFVEKSFAGKLETVPSDVSASFNALEDIESLLTRPGLINVDEEDITEITSSSSRMVVVSAEESGENRAIRLGQKIISEIPAKFQNEASTAVLFNVTGSPDITLYEINDIAKFIYDAAAPNANIVFGAVIDDDKKDYVRATVVFGGN